MCQLLRFGVSLLDQVNVRLWGFNAFLRLLPKSVQNINPPADLDRDHDTVGVGRVPQGNLENAAANPLKGLASFGIPANWMS